MIVVAAFLSTLQAVKVLCTWSSSIAVGAAREGSQIELMAQLRAEGGRPIFPATSGTWASLLDQPLLPDQPDLAALFAGQAGVTLLDLPQENLHDR